MDRVSTFRAFIARSPGDPFPRYGLAMELKGQGRLDDAAAAFAELIGAFPDYVPAYLMAGQVQQGLGAIAQAAALFRTGISAAERRGDRHAASELAAALESIAAT